ncbi:MAG: preprotein translocase subunit YajC [Rickettsiales bacterium]|jgi:preprotein translocase subunit YajC|nr:preprotein translocase subunit YajC [Rickettsiales bacterium]
METATVEVINGAAPAAGGNSWGLVIYCVVIFAILYFFMIRPNKRKMNEYSKMLAELKVGAKIVCAGGIYGTVKKIDGDKISVEIAKGVVIEIAKQAVINIEK